jgi:hypothetical protein
MIDIRELRGSDNEQIASFLSSQTGASKNALRKRLAWLLRNPALTPDIPFGIGAFRDTCLRGVMMCAPNRFHEGCVTKTCVLSILFYVDRDARGSGLPVFLKFRALAGRYPLYVATANAVASQIWLRLGGTPVAGSDCEYVHVCRILPIGQEALARAIRRSPSRPLAQADDNLSQYSHNDHLRPLATPDEAVAIQAGCAQGPGQYAIVQDVDFFRWKVYEAGESVYAYQFGDSRCLCVFQHSRRGYRQQIACTEIVDLCGNLAARDVSDFLRSVRQAFSPDLIMFRGCSRLAGMEALAQKFKKRRFDFPAAWLMDPNRLLEGRFGYSPLAGE